MKDRVLLIALICTIVCPFFPLGTGNAGNVTEAVPVHLREGYYTHHLNDQLNAGSMERLMEDMEDLESGHPNIVELTTAQEEFGLPTTTNGNSIPILRITNESRTGEKPGVLFLGGHHGDEVLSVEIPYYLAEFLVENYQSGLWIDRLIDERELVFMPVVNPDGWTLNTRENADGQDVNRDYPYGPEKSSFDSDGIPLSTVETQSVMAVMNSCIFVTGITWHSGTEIIGYPWGTQRYIHKGECPDHFALINMGEALNAAAGSGPAHYDVGTMQDVIYPAAGTWEDMAYAGAWDTDNMAQGTSAPTSRTLTFLVEAYFSKGYAPGDVLGGPDGVLDPGSEANGLIPQNIRLSLTAADLARPYVEWVTKPGAIEVDCGEAFNVSWQTGGALLTDMTHIDMGNSTDVAGSTFQSSADLSGGSRWDGTVFCETLHAPDEPGTYYIQASAVVDQTSLNQNDPDPKVPPQSFYVNQRTDDSYTFSVGDKHLNGSTTWTSPVIAVKVTNPDPVYSWDIHPANWTQDVNRSMIVYASYPLPLDPDSVNGSSLHLEYANGTGIPGTVSCDYRNGTVRFTPGHSMAGSSTVKVMLETGIRSADGTPLPGDISWYFITEGTRTNPPPDPMDDLSVLNPAWGRETAVPLNDLFNDSDPLEFDLQNPSTKNLLAEIRTTIDGPALILRPLAKTGGCVNISISASDGYNPPVYIQITIILPYNQPIIMPRWKEDLTLEVREGSHVRIDLLQFVESEDGEIPWGSTLFMELINSSSHPNVQIENTDLLLLYPRDVENDMFEIDMVSSDGQRVAGTFTVITLEPETNGGDATVEDGEGEGSSSAPYLAVLLLITIGAAAYLLINGMKDRPGNGENHGRQAIQGARRTTGPKRRPPVQSRSRNVSGEGITGKGRSNRRGESGSGTRCSGMENPNMKGENRSR